MPHIAQVYPLPAGECAEECEVLESMIRQSLPAGCPACAGPFEFSRWHFWTPVGEHLDGRVIHEHVVRVRCKCDQYGLETVAGTEIVKES